MSRRIITFLLVVGALGAIVLSGLMVTTGGEDRARCSGVEFLFPERGSNVLRQSEIGADLDPGRTGVLLIDGTEIPEDQLRRNEPLNQVFFSPAEGKEIEQLAPGAHTAAVVHWSPVESETRADADTCVWSFEVS